ncbi:MAG: murein biosynthesis integral membrane protein MurJ [Phycisphaerales bacterium]
MSADRFEKNARTFTLLTLASRATGLVRDATLARAFGVGAVMDAFSFGFMVPNLFRRLFGEGALTASFLPIYARLEREDPEKARRFASYTLVAMALVLNAIVIVLELVLLWLHARSPIAEISYIGQPVSIGGAVVAPMSLRLGQLGYELLMVMLPYMPLVCMVAIVGSVLQTHDKFGTAAASPMILNLAVVGTALGFLPVFHANGHASIQDQARHATLVGASVVVAGVLQLAWGMWAARRYGLRLRGVDLRDPMAIAPLKETLHKAVPMMFGLGVLQLNTFLDGLIASWPTVVGPTIFGVAFPLEEGAMAALGNAQRLYEFPLGVFGLAVANAIFPVLSRQATDMDAFRATMHRGLRLVMYIGLPASVGLMMVARPAVAVVLEGGRFTPEDTARVARILLGYAPAIWSYSTVHVLTRAFYASGDSVTPTKISVAMVFLNLTLNITLIFTPLREAGLAWATAICSVIQCGILLVILRRRVGVVVNHEVRASWMATAFASTLMAVAIAAVRWIVFPPADVQALTGWWGAVRELLVLMPVGAAVLLGATIAMRRPELRWALGRK